MSRAKRRSLSFAAAVLCLVNTTVGVGVLASDGDGDTQSVAAQASADPGRFDLDLDLDVDVPDVSLPQPTGTTAGPPPPAPSTTAPPSTTARPVTTTTATTTTQPATHDYGTSPLEPGTEAYGSGDMGASRTVREGRTTLVASIYARDLYGPEEMQASAEVHDDEGILTFVRIEFGDGTSWEPSDYPNYCVPDHPSHPRPTEPNPSGAAAPMKKYAQAGDYHVSITIRTSRCDYSTLTLVDEHVVSATLTVHVHAQSCRPGIIRSGCG